MATPEERTQAVVRTRAFLEQFCAVDRTRPAVPDWVRRTARGLLRHYPDVAHLDQAALAWPGTWAGERLGRAVKHERAPSYLELLARLRELDQPASVGAEDFEWRSGTATRLSLPAGFGYVRDSADDVAYTFSLSTVLRPSDAHALCVGRPVQFRVNRIGRVFEPGLGKTTIGLRMNAPSQPIARGGFASAVARGLEARRTWTREGVLLSTADFASARGVTPEMLVALRASGELFSVVVDDQVWWPAELLKVAPQYASALCQALENAADSRKVAFLVRNHGALGARTAAEAVASGRIAEVLRLAEDWGAH